jgi:rubrerythrin
MELGTFGLIMSFAMDLEESALAMYEKADLGLPAELVDELVRGNRKRLKRLERGRREGVVEMVLEAITGLDGNDYQVEFSAGDSLDRAVEFEEVSARFYKDAAAKLPIREISRMFRRFAEENEKRHDRLMGI